MMMKLLLYMKPCLGRECGGESRTFRWLSIRFAMVIWKWNEFWGDKNVMCPIVLQMPRDFFSSSFFLAYTNTYFSFFIITKKKNNFLLYYCTNKLSFNSSRQLNSVHRDKYIIYAEAGLWISYTALLHIYNMWTSTTTQLDKKNRGLIPKFWCSGEKIKINAIILQEKLCY